MRITGMAREESSEYPVAVVREAIVNAVAHRDYSIRGEGIRLLMFSDRLELYSPGRLPGHVTLENLKDERYSRNEAIVAVLSDVGYIERLGYGIDRMIATMQDAGLPAPEFEETSAGFKVTLRSGSDELVSAAGGAALDARLPQRTPGARRWHSCRMRGASPTATTSNSLPTSAPRPSGVIWPIWWRRISSSASAPNAQPITS
ncbi:MAG: ATP-binding protein [Caldilineaceae bacterium]